MLDITEHEVMKNWEGSLNEPRVSVCMACFNHEKFVEEAVVSVLRQSTTFPFEIIIGEDCSTDETLLIIENLRSQFPNVIKIINHIENSGMVNNYLSMIKESSGKFIAFCEGDDYWTDHLKLEKQVSEMEGNDGIVICYGDVIAFNHDGPVVGYSGGFCRDLSSDELKKSFPVNTVTVMFRNVRLEFPEEIKLTKYFDLFLWSMLGYYGSGRYIPNISPCMYRVHSGGTHSGATAELRAHNHILTYSLLMNYHYRKGRQDVVEHYRIKIISQIIYSFRYRYFFRKYLHYVFTKTFYRMKMHYLDVLVKIRLNK